MRMVFFDELPTIAARTCGVNSPPSSAYRAASEMSHSFSESTRVPSISHSTACMDPIVSRRRAANMSERASRVEIMTILVTGATRNIGRRMVDHLIDLGANDIRALTNNPEKADLPDGVRPVTGYLGNP